MSKILLLSVFLFFTVFTVSGQENFTVKGDSLKPTPKPDTAKYINLGKVAARKAIFRSMMIPGWGQAGNGLNVYRGIKIAAIYTGGTLLVMSYFSNTKLYHQYLREVQYRAANNNLPLLGNGLESIENQAGLITAKDVYRRNREVVIFSMVGLYAINVIDAYVDARLKYFDVGSDLAIKISPTVINSNTLYGYNSFSPALKIAFRL